MPAPKMILSIKSFKFFVRKEITNNKLNFILT